jgi:uncharacterized protein (TIGR03435 family)
MRFVLTIALAVFALGAQPRAFEVASIRLRQGPISRMAMFSSSGPRLTLEAYSPMELVREAYSLELYQVSFAASIAASTAASISQPEATYYDIVAKADGDATPSRAEFRQMLQTLLAERFNLKVHREMKEMPVYALVVARSGPKFKESASDAALVANHGVNGRNQNVTLSRATMEVLARDIRGSFGVDRPVLDKTGLTGTYDIKIEATPEFRMNRVGDDPGQISVFTAVQQQLGLKFEPQKAPIEKLDNNAPYGRGSVDSTLLGVEPARIANHRQRLALDPDAIGLLAAQPDVVAVLLQESEQVPVVIVFGNVFGE